MISDYVPRLNRAIPGGAHTYSRGFDQFPENAPAILARGEGAYVWDPWGNRFVDYGMGLRAVTLGYANGRVNEAAIAQILNGNNLTRASMVELEAAELLIDLIPAAEMVKFAKNGSNVTTAAVKLARAFTGRDGVCVPNQQPFFSFDDWFIGSTVMDRGVPKQEMRLTHKFDYGCVESLEAQFMNHPDEIACVVMEAATTLVPCHPECRSNLSVESPCGACPTGEGNFLHAVQALCKKYGALFILDEMITGFRWHLQGAAAYFGIQPDLLTFGKGMANGFSVAALCGRQDVMELGSIDTQGAERMFLLSSTHGSEMSSLGAFVETVDIYREYNVVAHLWEYGGKLHRGLNDVAQAVDAKDFFSVEGPDICLNYVLRDSSGEVSLPLRTVFAQEMVRFGVLMPWISPSLAHDETTLAATLDAAYEALTVVAKAANQNPEIFLEGPAIKPVFRRYN